MDSWAARKLHVYFKLDNQAAQEYFNYPVS